MTYAAPQGKFAKRMKLDKDKYHEDDERIEVCLGDLCDVRAEVERLNTERASLVRMQLCDKEIISSLEAEVARLLQAIGLATTSVPSMVMRPDDPIGMMQEVCAENARLKEAVRWAADRWSIYDESKELLRRAGLEEEGR